MYVGKCVCFIFFLQMVTSSLALYTVFVFSLDQIFIYRIAISNIEDV